MLKSQKMVFLKMIMLFLGLWEISQLPPKEEINLIDVGANQIASIAASCIPF